MAVSAILITFTIGTTLFIDVTPRDFSDKLGVVGRPAAYRSPLSFASWREIFSGPRQPMMKFRPTALSRVELAACNETDQV
ncbi:MAG: hypothetical protein QOH31_3403 [Verrucomicrobiota bacterium]|jgi:hypothetical protein